MSQEYNHRSNEGCDRGDRTVNSDRGSVAAGGNVDFGQHNRIAGRDYHEHKAELREDEPEWKAPPHNSGLILCPGCKRRHIARNAIACTRCGYPQREVMMEEHRRFMVRMNHERAKDQACGMLSFVAGTLLGMFRFDLTGFWPLMFGAVCGFLGYHTLPPFFQWLNSQIGDRD